MLACETTCPPAYSPILPLPQVAFVPAEELYSLGSPWALLNLLLVGMFGLDLVLSFRCAATLARGRCIGVLRARKRRCSFWHASASQPLPMH